MNALLDFAFANEASFFLMFTANMSSEKLWSPSGIHYTIYQPSYSAEKQTFYGKS